MIIHLGLVIALGLWMMPRILKISPPALLAQATEEPDEELQTVLLDEQLEAATKLSFASSSGDPLDRLQHKEVQTTDEVAVDEELLKDPDTTISLDGLLADVPSRGQLLEDIPDGAPGRAREIVDGYQQAMDRITQEIIKMLYEQHVLLIWCFDQSESMKDDQKEIRNRIERVYQELELTDQTKDDALLTAVTSYGQGFAVHTRRPTSNLEEIRKAIDSVPVDSSGKEMMCQAVGMTIKGHRTYVTQGKRRMMLILVTDESGERENNAYYLEPMIAEAKAARCKIYILGREAAFGYPFVHFRWVHPQTRHVHWLPVDRGPETGFVEQMQTDGFARRRDAYPSGFGPYEQCRMAHQTGGIFFMLPSLESSLVRGEKRRYELEAMRGYGPDLRARPRIIADRDQSKLRMAVWKIIYDLNPYRKEVADVMEMRVRFSPDYKTFVGQVRRQHQKAAVYLAYLNEAVKALEKMQHVRDNETSPRWQANFDLLRAQLMAYKVRVYEYGAFLDHFVKNPQKVPLTKPPDLRLEYWAIGTQSAMLTQETTGEYLKQANALLGAVAKSHPGTPWAARAQWEMNRGYGVTLSPVYWHTNPPKGKGGGGGKPAPRIPIPNL